MYRLQGEPGCATHTTICCGYREGAFCVGLPVVSLDFLSHSVCMWCCYVVKPAFILVSASSPEGRHDRFLIFFSLFLVVLDFVFCFMFYVRLFLSVCFLFHFSFVECVCRACRIQYDGIALRCRLTVRFGPVFLFRETCGALRCGQPHRTAPYRWKHRTVNNPEIYEDAHMRFKGG